VGTILLVDGDYIQRPVLARMLSDEGRQVIEVKNAEEALQTLQEVSVDLVITAISLSPRMNGDQFIVRLSLILHAHNPNNLSTHDT
jgi:CheY-like chemotaxis protein